MNFADTTDFDNADQGFIAALEQPRIMGADGQLIWGAGAYAFMDAECPGIERTPALCLSHGAPPLADDSLWPSQLAAWSTALPRPTLTQIIERSVQFG